MKFICTSLAAIAIVALTAGYIASQYAFFNGAGAAYAKQVDTPAVAKLALALIIASVGCGLFLKQNPEDSAE